MGTALHRVAFGEGETAVDARRHAQRLIAMAGDLLALAEELEGRADRPAANGHAEPNAVVHDPRTLADLARTAYRARRLRAQFFDGGELFGEPGWDLLLDLFIASNEGKQVPVTSACIGAAVPTTTALRWLTILESRGLVDREADGADARRVFVRLTAQAHASMAAYFARTSQAARSEEPRLPFMLSK